MEPSRIYKLYIENPHDYYEAKRDMGVEGRSASRLFYLRTFNNWIKSALFELYSHDKMSVLDLCCGKGGDINKWRIAKIGHYVGVDIAKHNISHAIERFNKIPEYQSFPSIFIVADMSTDQSISSYLQENILFDIVSCQFSMHYFFSTEQNARNFFINVSSRLVPGGFFLATIPDSDVIVKKIREAKQNDPKYSVFSFGNGFYRVVLPQKKFPIDKPFGIQYYYYLEDSVGSQKTDGLVYVPEYLIPIAVLIKLASEYGLEPVEILNFHEFYEKYYEKFKCKFHKMVKIEEDEEKRAQQWDAIYMYKAVTFKKKGAYMGPQGNCGNKIRVQKIPKDWE